MDSYSRETIFHLPGIFEKGNIYLKLLDLYENHKEYFRDNLKIGSIYGTPIGAIWNGGRMLYGVTTWGELHAFRDFMEKKRIPVRFTFTNCLIEKQHVYDTYCNNVLDIFNTGNNEVICNSPILEKYIRKKYGNNYRYISSTTKRITDKTLQQNEVNKNYYLTVLDYDFNSDMEFLKGLEHKEKCEILCNPVCQPKCPRREFHYKNISECQLKCNPHGVFACPDDRKTFYDAQKTPNFISEYKIEKLTEMGFKHFKLEGRTAKDSDFINILTYYLIKDKYQELVRQELKEQ